MRLRSGSVRHRSGIDGLSFSYSGLSPWDLRPLWAGVSILCINKAQPTSSKLVRTRIKVLLLLYCIFYCDQEDLEAIPCSACVCVDSQCHAANVVIAISFQFLCCFCFLASRIQLNKVRV